MQAAQRHPAWLQHPDRRVSSSVLVVPLSWQFSKWSHRDGKANQLTHRAFMYSAHAKLWTSGSCHTEEISILHIAVVVLLSLFRVTLCASFVHEPECHQSRGAAASQVQTRCSLKQEAVGRKHQPSSSNCCHLWKGGADVISKPETQEDCSFGLSFHFCSPKKAEIQSENWPWQLPTV